MRLALPFLVATAAFGCSQKPAEAAPAIAQAPDTNKVEGHGGIAIVEPGKAPLVVGDAKPAAGVVNPTDFLKPPGCPSEVDAKDAYLRGYQLKDSVPADALKEFELVVRCTRPGSEYNLKAAARIEELKKP